MAGDQTQVLFLVAQPREMRCIFVWVMLHVDQQLSAAGPCPSDGILGRMTLGQNKKAWTLATKLSPLFFLVLPSIHMAAL